MDPERKLLESDNVSNVKSNTLEGSSPVKLQLVIENISPIVGKVKRLVGTTPKLCPLNMSVVKLLKPPNSAGIEPSNC